jgi:AraC family transcriptional regulator
MGSGRIKAEIRSSSGATAARIISGPSEDPPHHHEWPVLSIHVMGEMTKLCDEGEVPISSASAVFHARGASHANIVGEHGCEQIDIVFDPGWLKLETLARLSGVPCWIGGPVALAARKLARIWSSQDIAEDDLRRITKGFFRFAANAALPRQPLWLPAVLEKILQNPNLTAADLAPVARCRPDWLTQAFRAAMGEGLAETSRRIRVEKAALLLRTTQRPAAEIATEAGFCDQSHMNRCFRQLLGRTPLQVRLEGLELFAASTSGVGKRASTTDL